MKPSIKPSKFRKYIVQFNHKEAYLVGNFMEQDGKGGEEPNLQEKTH